MKFSHSAGVYENPFDLTLSAPDGYTIYYTLDGSDPRLKGTKYSSSLRMTNTDTMAWGNLTKLCRTITGADGGKLADLCTVCIRLPETETYKVQELTEPVYHALCAALEAHYFS